MGGRDPEILERYLPEPPSEEEMRAMEAMSIADFQIFFNRMQMISYEGAELMFKMGATPAFLAGDMCTGVYTAQGDMAVNYAGVKAHAVTLMIPIKYTIKHWTNDPTVGVRDGDIFFCNDPSYGGVHPPDMFIFMPVFHKDRLLAWVGSMAHSPETGATDPGGIPAGAKTRYEEGMRIPPVKIGENFTLKEDVVTLMENMVRDPRSLTLDNKARVAACLRMRRRILETVEEKGWEHVTGGLRKCLMVAAEGIRRRLRKYNDGTYRHVLFLDVVGREEALVKISIAVTKKGDRIVTDLTGTGPEVDASLNGRRHQVHLLLPTYLCSHICWELPPSVELLAPFEFIVPEGCLCAADPERAQTAGAGMGIYASQVLQILFAKMIFDSEDRDFVVAPFGSNPNVIFWGGGDRHGNPVASMGVELNAAGSGGRPDKDGVDAAGFIPASGPVDCLDAEECESRDPILYLYRNKYCRDNVGHGKYRGGASLEMAYGVHKVPFLAMGGFGFGSRFASPVGLFGGYAGGMFPGLRVLDGKLSKAVAEGKPIPTCTEELFGQRTIEGTYISEPPASPFRMLSEGSWFVSNQSAGGGYGDVLEREPRSVVQDVENRIISDAVARQVYRVAYDPETFVVDEEETKRLREAEREERKRRGKVYADFEREWLQKRPPEEALKYYGVWPDAWV